MTRRETLTAFLGKKEAPTKKQNRNTNTTLATYAGNWEYAQAAHLLRRTMYGATNEQIKLAAQNSLEATINHLLADVDSTLPLNYYESEDTYAPIGTTWVGQPSVIGSNKANTSRTRSLLAWTMGNLLEEGGSIFEKMTLFWHNHFAIEFDVVNDQQYIHRYKKLIRDYALGNFKDLVKKITIDVTMLRYLNGNQNTKSSPNENFARELLELFTVGKGDLAGSGDYTTFTETDVAAMAKVLTGWRDFGYHSEDNPLEVRAYFTSNRHDKNDKQLSHRFGNAVINNAEDEEYSNLIDIIFEQDAVATFICRKLYRWFVYYEISEVEEVNIIEPLAQILRDNNYEIRPVLAALLSSEHFYHNDNVGCLIKNPFDFLMDIFKKFNAQLPADLNGKYSTYILLVYVAEALQMTYYAPPNVAGWKAYYQEPAYNRVWINSSTIKSRIDIINWMIYSEIDEGDAKAKIDLLAFVATLEKPEDPNELIKEIAQIVFPNPLSDSQITYLKNFLIPGLPDFEWTVEYSEYLSHPNDMDIRTGVENKLKYLIATMLTMPEFQLS